MKGSHGMANSFIPDKTAPWGDTICSFIIVQFSGEIHFIFYIHFSLVEK